MHFKKLMMVAVVGTFLSGQAYALNWKELGFALGCTFAGGSRFNCPKTAGGRENMWDKVWALQKASDSDLINIKNSKDAPQEVRDAAQHVLSKRQEKPAPRIPIKQDRIIYEQNRQSNSVDKAQYE